MHAEERMGDRIAERVNICAAPSEFLQALKELALDLCLSSSPVVVMHYITMLLHEQMPQTVRTSSLWIMLWQPRL
jgi:hypothetical protein